jgi:hypothetical protein
MLSTFVHPSPRNKLVVAVATVLCSLIVALALSTASAEAARSAPPYPAPSCVSTTDDFPFTYVTNNCGRTLRFRVVYTFMTTPCSDPVPHGATVAFWRGAWWNRYVRTEVCP